MLFTIKLLLQLLQEKEEDQRLLSASSSTSITMPSIIKFLHLIIPTIPLPTHNNKN
eukprot:UN08256